MINTFILPNGRVIYINNPDKIEIHLSKYLSSIQYLDLIDFVRNNNNNLSFIENDETISLEQIENDDITIKGKVYSKSKDCYYVRGKYYLKTDEDIRICAISNTPERIDYMRSLLDNIVIKNNKIESFDEIFVLSRYAKHSPVLDVNGNLYNMLNENSVKDTSIIEDIETGCFVPVYNYINKPISKIKHYDKFENYFNNVDLTTKEELKIGKKSVSYRMTEGIKYKFGVELEIARGFLPIWKSNRFNVLAMRDGSLNNREGGLELVTGVLTGDTGFAHLKEICDEMSYRSYADRYCGIHCHIGGFEFTNQFIINSYKLGMILEKQIQLLLPPSRRNNEYCRNLKKLNINTCLNPNDPLSKADYNTIFKHISYEKINNPSFDFNKDTQHPMGAKCEYNHNTPRYCWLNFVPAVFNTRNNINYKTIEFRNMQGSTSYKKIKNWVLLCMGFVAFANKYPELIHDDLTIMDVLFKIYPKKAHKLMMYFEECKELYNSPNFDESAMYLNEVTDRNKIIKNNLKELVCV